MSLRNLPEIKAFERPEGLQWDAPSDALARWAGGPQAAEADDPNTVSIFDVIGQDPWTGGGFTAKRMSAALRSIGPKPVSVAINSPGGDFFEGLAIYNLLREHPAKVNVRVMGLAASAASVIAMAGDEIAMGMGSFLMIHNAWAVVIGNRHDLGEASTVLEQFDAAMADIYAARSGMDAKAIAKLMDAESFIGAGDAVAKGFADTVTNEPAGASASGEARSEVGARRRLDALLAQQGLPRSERRRLLREATGTHDAAGDTTLRAGDATAIAADVRRLIDTLKV
jgi:ATP-dependent protease ClpP protease subunit